MIIKKWKVSRGYRCLVKCDFCGKTEERPLAHASIKRGKNHYCNRKCKSEFLKTKTPWNKGLRGCYSLSEEHKKNISKALIGHIKSEEHRRNLSKAHTGKTLPKETKERISISRKGKASGKDNYMWKGGRYRDKRGYVLVKLPSHPFCDNRGYIYEHRLMAEKALGRHLKSSEHVHHRNNDHSDNRNDNFVISTASYHQEFLHHRRKKNLSL